MAETVKHDHYAVHISTLSTQADANETTDRNIDRYE